MTAISKRQLLAAAAAAAMPVPALAQQEQDLYAAAKKDSELTWYSGHVNAETSEAVGAAFTKLYPGVKVNVVRSTSQVAFQRLSQDMRAGVAQCDVFSSTDVGHSLFLKREGKYLQYRPKNVDAILPVLRGMDPDGYFTAAFPGVWLMSFNSAKVPAAEAPQSWRPRSIPSG